MQTFLDVVSHRFILTNLVQKEFKAMYRSMALGVLWTVLQPLVMVTVLSLIFAVFYRTGPHYPARLIIALIPYNFLSYTLSAATGAILNNRSLVKKVRFPRQILPFSVVITHAIHFAIQSLLIAAVIVVFPPEVDVFGWQWLWLPAILVVHLGLALGLALLVSALNVVYRDVQYIVDSVLTVAFWLSPVIYSARERLLLPGHPDFLAGVPWLVRHAYYLNPFAGIAEAYRGVLYEARPPDAVSFAMAAAITLVIGALGVRAFWRHERHFADLI